MIKVCANIYYYYETEYTVFNVGLLLPDVSVKSYDVCL